MEAHKCGEHMDSARDTVFLGLKRQRATPQRQVAVCINYR